MNVLYGITGSVAAKLAPNIVNFLLAEGYIVKVVATTPSQYFFDKDSLNAEVYNDEDEWGDEYYQKSSSILHIELRKWADVMLIAPLTANTLAKLANGMADNLLASTVRAWDRGRPIVLAPAMNTHMWNHPVTTEHLNTLSRWYNVKVVEPVEKNLACGDVGVGALADISSITNAVVESFVKQTR